MGCFTGQTARVGYIAKLIGPQATRAQINTYLGNLTAEPTPVGASIGYPLTNAEYPAPPPPPVRKAAPARPRKRS